VVTLTMDKPKTALVECYFCRIRIVKWECIVCGMWVCDDCYDDKFYGGRCPWCQAAEYR
jgi:hypothetical protein